MPWRVPIDAGNTRSLPRTRHSYTLSASSRVSFHPSTAPCPHIRSSPPHSSNTSAPHALHMSHPPPHRSRTSPASAGCKVSFILRPTLENKHPRRLSLAGNMSATSQPVDVAYYRCSWCCWEKQHLVDGCPSCIYGLTLSAWCDLGDRAACLVRANAHASQNALRRKGPLRVHGPCACASYHQA